MSLPTATHTLIRLGANILLALTAVYAQAATSTWNGGGGDNSFSTGANWGGTAPSSGDDLVFAGSTRLTPSLGSNFSISSLEFAGGAGAFTLGGNTLTIDTGGIVNNSSSAQVIGNQITVGQNQTWNASSGSVTFNGYVGGGGKNLTLDGSHALTFNNQLNGAGTLAISGSGARTFNDYTSATTLNAGGTGTSNYNAQLNVTNLNVSSGTHLFNSTVNASTFYLTGGTATLGGTGSKNISGTVVDGGTLIMNQSGGGDAINGSLTINNGGSVVFAQDNQIPAWTTVTLNAGSSLYLGDTDQTFTSLVINGDSVIDFGTGGSSLNLTSYASGVTIAGGVTLTIQNWDASNGDVFAGSNPGANVVNVQYADSNGDIYATGTWGGGYVTPGTPVPEPSTYGLLMLGSGVAFVLLRRRPR